MAPDDVRIIEDTERRFEDNTVLRVRVLTVPESEKFPDGVKYRLHYGTEAGDTLIRYDNSHGYHERHIENGVKYHGSGDPWRSSLVTLHERRGL